MTESCDFSKYYYIFLFLILVVLSSCSYKNSSHLLKFPKSFNTDTLKTIAVSNPKTNYEVYKIKPFDLISVRNLQNPELLGSTIGEVGRLNFTYKVTNDGDMILPVIGAIKVIGLTRAEAKNKIQALYTESLFKDPIIELNINSLKVTLLGPFKTEGNLILENEDYDLIDIIGQAGGMSEDANIKKIRIIRGDRKNPELILVDLSNINTLSNTKLIMQDGDIVIAETSKFSSFLKGAQNFNTISSVGIILLNTYIIFKNLNKY